MTTRDLPASEAENASAAALHQLKELLQQDQAFAEALWRHRGTLVSGGLPTCRG